MCVEVKTTQSQLIIDAGTGIRHTLGPIMKKLKAQKSLDIHLYFTHFHWDHILGLPFFSPIYIPGAHLHFYSVQEEMEEVVRTLFKKPFFPVPFGELKSTLSFHQLRPRTAHLIGDMEVTPYLLDHPDVCWGAKITHENKSYAHCVDTEGVRLSAGDLGPDLPLYQNVDLMVYDAQYSIAEAREKVNWGHSSAQRGFEVALREKIKKVVFVHHDPFASDEDISHTVNEAIGYFEQGPHDLSALNWEIGHEGMSIKL